MCIINDSEKVAKLRQQMTVLQLWKVVEKNNGIGLWADTRRPSEFQVGENVARRYTRLSDSVTCPGAFHCTFTRKAARRYRDYKASGTIKIIRVSARTADIVSAGRDKYINIISVSVSKMEIKSLKHQR